MRVVYLWTQIINAGYGEDLSGDGNYMCVGHQECDIVKKCLPGYTKSRPKPLEPTGTVDLNGYVVYFYKDLSNGNIC